MERKEINFLDFKRINVIGCPGAGKSTASKRISQLTGYPIFDLDIILYNENCKRLDKYKTEQAIDCILQKEQFIIDGTYTTTLKKRLLAIDLVVIIDSNWILSIYRFFKRLFYNQGLKCGEKLTFKTLMLLVLYPLKTKPLIMKEITNCKVFFINYSR